MSYQAYAVTIRPREGITDEQICHVDDWIHKVCDYYHVITEKCDKERHLHAALFLKSCTTRASCSRRRRIEGATAASAPVPSSPPFLFFFFFFFFFFCFLVVFSMPRVFYRVDRGREVRRASEGKPPREWSTTPECAAPPKRHVRKETRGDDEGNRPRSAIVKFM